MEIHVRSRQPTENMIKRMRFTRWIREATNTHSEYLKLTIFFIRNQWPRERALMSRYTRSCSP